jgi:ABC-type multidrug transport system ATPase subunit
LSAPVIEVQDLYKSYGPVEAVRGLSFVVEQGEVFGLLGPNGAGKTSTVEMLEGLRMPDRGTVRVCKPAIASRKRLARFFSRRTFPTSSVLRKRSISSPNSIASTPIQTSY